MFTLLDLIAINPRKCFGKNHNTGNKGIGLGVLEH